MALFLRKACVYCRSKISVQAWAEYLDQITCRLDKDLDSSTDHALDMTCRLLSYVQPRYITCCPSANCDASTLSSKYIATRNASGTFTKAQITNVSDPDQPHSSDQGDSMLLCLARDFELDLALPRVRQSGCVPCVLSLGVQQPALSIEKALRPERRRRRYGPVVARYRLGLSGEGRGPQEGRAWLLAVPRLCRLQLCPLLYRAWRPRFGGYHED